MEKIRVLLFRSQTYDLPITTSDSLPMDYRRLVGATITGESLGTLTLLGWFSYLVSSVVLNTKKYKHVNKLTRLKSPVQARKYSRPGNDSRTRNDPQTGLPNDPGPEMVSSSKIKNGMDSKKGKVLYLNDFVCLRHAELITADERETKTSTKFSCPTRHEFSQVESRKVTWFFSLLLCQNIPAATKRLTIRKGSACCYDN